MKSIKWSLALSISVLMFGCTKENNTEKIIVSQRQANENIKTAMTVSGENQIVISKSSLGKAFILIPAATTSGQHPDLNYLRPLIISFEKSGNKVALFNLTEEQLYSTIPADKLLQTFKVSSENDSTITLDLGDGFTSFDAKQSLGVILKEIMTDVLKAIQSGAESSLEVKDSFVRSARTANNSIFIEQVMRVKANSLQEKTAPFDPAAKPKLEWISTESSSTVTFEIMPYFANSNFQPKIYDKEQRIGYFLNFAVRKQVDEPIPQITRWDVNPNRAPIVVRIHEAAPAAALKAMREGILYWNRVMGREFMVIGNSFTSEEKQVDRTIHVYWIPWDTAGFARAGFQADPITGEIFRAQVFMTSSWYKTTHEQLKLILGAKNQDSNSGYTQCAMDQSKVFDADIANLVDDAAIERATLDTIRLVLAHEMGHTLGLRHNFVGSSTTEVPDSDFKKHKSNYLRGDLTGLAASSTTVMDYTQGIETAIDGSVLANTVLPYDKLAIDWAYNNTEINLPKYQYCSDEHIILANAMQKKIYGCERFDKYKNVILGNIDSIVSNQNKKTMLLFKSVLDAVSKPESFFEASVDVNSLTAALNYGMTIEFAALEPFVYKDPSANFYSVNTVIDGLLPSLNGTPLTTADLSVNAKIKSDSTAFGGVVGIFEQLLDLQKTANGKLYQNQTAIFFDNLDPVIYQGHLTPSQFDKIKAKLIADAKLADESFLLTLLTSLPLAKTIYALDPVSKELKITDAKLSSYFFIGNVTSLTGYYLSAYESLIHHLPVKGTVNGIEKEYKFVVQPNTYIDILRKFFAPSMVMICPETDCMVKLIVGNEKAKALAVANTIEIMSALGLPPTLAKSDNLLAQLNLVEWTKISGITKANLQAEIDELVKLEALK